MRTLFIFLTSFFLGRVVEFCVDGLILKWVDTALLQRVELGKQAGPSQHDLELLRRWLISSKGNNGDLQGPGFDIWKEEEDVGEECAKVMDFVVLSAKHTGRDSFLSWMEDKGFHILHRLFGCLVKVRFLFFSNSAAGADKRDRRAQSW